MEVESFKKNVVRQNSLITAKFKLTCLEYRMILYCMHKMQVEKNNTFFIDVDEFGREVMQKSKDKGADKAGAAKKKPKHKDLKGKMIQVFEGLTDKSVFVNTKVDGGQNWTKFKWLSTYTAQYRETNGKKDVFKGCSASIHENLIPYLLGLEKNFTIVYLSEAYSLESFYAIRLFELMVRFNERVFKVSVTSLKQYLGVGESMYSEYKQFKQRVITPSLKSVNQLNGVKVAMKEVKEKGKVVYLVFTSKIILNLESAAIEKKNIEIEGAEVEQDVFNQVVNEETELTQDVSSQIVSSDIMESANQKDVQMDLVGVSYLREVLKAKEYEDSYEELNVPKCIKMTKPAMELFAKEFKYYNFEEPDLAYIILSAWEHIQQKDGVKGISMRQYKYFTGEIQNRIQEEAYNLANRM